MVAGKLPKPSPARSRNMAAIRSKHTKPELLVRKLLHRAGFRYRLHQKKLPGTPDLAFRKWKAVIEVHGCFFHSHDCHFFRQPAGDSAAFWKEKLLVNAERDLRNAAATASLGWRRLIVWQCAVTGKTRLEQADLVKRVGEWLMGSESTGEIRGAELL